MATTAKRVREIQRVLAEGGLRLRNLFVAERGERVLVLAVEDADLERAREVLVSAGYPVEYTAGSEEKPALDIPGATEQEAPSLLVG